MISKCNKHKQGQKIYIQKLCFCLLKGNCVRIQVFHCENMLQFDEIMMSSAL